jgi:hypothetical protein
MILALKRIGWCLSFLLYVFFLYAVNQSVKLVQVSISKTHFLPHIPSASGVEVLQNTIYIIGDDSSWLYVLNINAQLTERIALFDSPDLINGRISKKAKPDFEALTLLPVGSSQQLLVAGSGSKSPERDNGYLINVHTSNIRPVSLTGLYNQLRQQPDVIGAGKLNIEGIAANHEQIIFIQRGNVTGNNVLISYPAEDLYNYLTAKSVHAPLPVVQPYVLPRLLELQSGFSGITFIPGTSQLLFTASVEDTANEIDDGEIMGSYIGLIDLHNPENTKSHLITFEGSTYPGKIESIAVQGVDISGHIRAVAVTDSDQGGSELLFLDIKL